MEPNTKLPPLSHISPLCLLRALLKDCWMILLSALICAMCVSMYYTHEYEYEYSSNITYVITSQRTSSSNMNNVTATKEVAAVFTELLDSPTIVAQICAENPELVDFDGTISASTVGESNFLTVTVRSSSAKDAFLALMALDDLKDTLLSYVSNRCVMQIIRSPSVSSYPINYVNTAELTKRAALIGAALMAVLLCAISLLRETVQTRTGGRHLLDAPILASLPHQFPKITLQNLLRTLWATLRGRSKKVSVTDPTTSFAYTEQINTVCALLEQEHTEHNRKLFLITGVSENEGKSTVAANIALTLAAQGKKVVLVDADLRNPSINRFFGRRYRPSLPLNQMLAEPFTRENMMRCMIRDKKLNLYLMFPDEPDASCTELLTGSTMKELLSDLQAAEYVIIDSPPIGFFCDAEALAELSDASMLVVRQDRTPAADINDAIDTLRRSGSAFLGCILNDMVELPHLSTSRGYGYGYGYGYGSKK